ncbi:hypothetical protein OSB04_010490 [Centaurea solstitialis]|uniref:Cation-transporting P-type ATPase N-terminal domain-containing protein n=1 Tax=Centaurea solstitialis TaxID=347529 RepID=A0AA38WPE2_9ASTR|nr:hypothetical protein OSB04_010490 [Centaurea solstitialis]
MENVTDGRFTNDKGLIDRRNSDVFRPGKHTIEEVFENLRCSKEGLTTSAAQERLAVFGHNKLEEKSKFLKFLGFMWNPLSWVMEAAAIMAIALANGGGKPPDWQDFVGIIILLFINSAISFVEENNAGNAAAALMARLAPKAKVFNPEILLTTLYGKWNEEDDGILVPGDIISIKLGDIIPADARLLDGDPLKIDQSALTGESLPVTKGSGDGIYSGSTCKQGEIEAVVIATGVHTFFGKAAYLVDTTNQVGHFQKASSYSENNPFLVFIICLVVSLTLSSDHGKYQESYPVRDVARNEDLTCSAVFAKGVDADTVVLMSARASRIENQDAIDAAIVGMLADPKEARADIQELHFLPFNPTDKRTAFTDLDNEGKMHRVRKGAPEQILNLAHNKSDIECRVHAIIDKFADRGLRSLAVAYQDVPEERKDSPGGPWQFVGLLPLFDPPRHDSADTIRRALDLGVNVKMITGLVLASIYIVVAYLYMVSQNLSYLSPLCFKAAFGTWDRTGQDGTKLSVLRLAQHGTEQEFTVPRLVRHGTEQKLGQGDQLAIGKETGHRLGMGTNMYPSSALLGQHADESIAALSNMDFNA